MINSRKKLSPEEHITLYWYSLAVEGANLKYEDFRITESLINRFNKYMSDWSRNFQNNPARFEKPVDWDIQRPKTEYFSNQLQKGHEFEVWAEEEFKKYGIDIGSYNDEKGQFSGENKAGIEIKHDMRFKETGNLYIEYKERLRSSQPWVNGGILKDDNTKYWLIGDTNRYFIFEKQALIGIYQRLANNETVSGCKMTAEKQNGTSMGFIMNMQASRKILFAGSIDEFVRKTNPSAKSPDIYYAINSFYHGSRDCRYIKNKSDEFITLFQSQQEAEAAGFARCGNPRCFCVK
ncbi:MAG: hypothetical protein IJ666_08015 [Ruminococcus sp.]|nr:hypothetical protein [Ruminococcus sp.]